MPSPRSNRICYFTAQPPGGGVGVESWFRGGDKIFSGPGSGDSKTFKVKPGTYKIFVNACIGTTEGAHDISSAETTIDVSGPTEIAVVSPGAEVPSSPTSADGSKIVVVSTGEWRHIAQQTCGTDAYGNPYCYGS